MGGFLRFIVGLVLLPACRAAGRTIVSVASAGATLTAGPLSFLAGIVAFAALWIFMPHPVKTYVLGHELTHALWGLMFGAVPSKLRVRESGGSVNLTKSNLLITLAPYFFPFYTFLVLVAAAATAYFVRPLPCLPAWLFAIGFTWAFHVLFTLQSLAQTQPDVTLYGRLFSWTFIFLANALAIVLLLAPATGYGYGGLWRTFHANVSGTYAFVYGIFTYIAGLLRPGAGK